MAANIGISLNVKRRCKIILSQEWHIENKIEKSKTLMCKADTFDYCVLKTICPLGNLRQPNIQFDIPAFA